MKKRIISMLLVLVMVLGMVPVTAFAAAVELPVSEGTVDITDATVGPYTITTLSVYLQGSYDPVSILSATQDGTTINVVLGEDTDPSAALQAGFGGTGNAQLQHSGNKCTLSNGKGTMNYSFAVRTGPQVAGQGSYTINFSVPMGEECQVTAPVGEGFTFTSGGAAYKDQPYTFQVAVNEGYDGSNMQVSCLFGEETVPLTADASGTYTVESVPGDITIQVTGVVAKTVYTVTPEVCQGVTFTGAETVYAGDPYTFTVAVAEGYDASGMVVAVNGEAVTLTNGRYTIPAVTGNTTITVTGVVKKAEYTVTLRSGAGYTLTGQATSYAGEPYTFTVEVDDAVYFADRIEVRVNGETVTLTGGSYTIEALNGDTVVTVENVVERQLFTVTRPEVSGVTFTGGETVREGKPYTFSVSVDVAYISAGMTVKISGEEVALTDGSYTIESVTGDLVITVEGVRAKEVYTVTKEAAEGASISGPDTVLETDPYTFTVTVDEIYDATGMVVTVNGEEVALDASGSYTVASVGGDLTIAVSGLIKKEVFRITEPAGGKFTFEDQVDGYVYKGATYTFTVTPKLGYVATVQVNGETVTGSDNQYTVENVSEDLVITVTTARVPLPETELDVADNVIDITDKTIYSYLSRYYANAVNISVSGVTVQEAYEDGTTVYVILPTDTADDAAVSVKVGTSVTSCTVSGDSGSLTLEEGEGSIVLNVQGKFSSSKKGTVSYTLIFFRNIPSETPPVRVMSLS